MELKITELLDDYQGPFPVDAADVPDVKRIKEATMKKIGAKRRNPLRIALIAGAAAVLLAGSALAVAGYTRITGRMERQWQEQTSTEMTQSQKDFVEERSADLGESVTDQGITVTVDSVNLAGDTVNLLYTFTLDPEVYDTEEYEFCRDWMTQAYVESENYGTVSFSTGGGGGALMEHGTVQQEEHRRFDLPQGASLGDGCTTLYLNMETIMLSGTDNEELEVSGSWCFAISLPETNTAEASGTEETLVFQKDLALTVRDILVEENGCSFTVETDTDDYFFAADGENAALAMAAEPDSHCFTVSALLKDGTQVPSNGSSMTFDEETELDAWQISWAVPLDPAEVGKLVFSDGTEEQAVSLTP